MAPYELYPDTIVCKHCKKKLSRRYFKRHQCLRFSISTNEERSEEQLQQMNIDSNPLVSPTVGEEDENMQTGEEIINENVPMDTGDSGSDSSDENSSAGEEELHENSDEDGSDDGVDEENLEHTQTSDKNGILCLLLLLWQLTFHVPRRAMEFLLKFINLAIICTVAYAGINVNFPNSVYKLESMFNDGIKYREYVVCVKCCKLHDFENCWMMCEGKKISRRCDHISFPNHPHLTKRGPCNEELLTTRVTTKGEKLVARKTYYYVPIEESIQVLINRPGFESMCEEWRSRATDDNFMSDIYDGNIWKEFTDNGFLQTPGNIGIVLNVDWFQPFLHTQYSVGAVYAAVLNLPREVRFQRENVILCGIIPQFSKSEDGEPPLNTFLKPLVNELNQAWHDGFMLNSHNSPEAKKVSVQLN